MAIVNKIFNKHNVVLGILLVALIMVGEFSLDPNHLATWPAFIDYGFLFYGTCKNQRKSRYIDWKLFRVMQSDLY